MLRWVVNSAALALLLANLIACSERTDSDVNEQNSRVAQSTQAETVPSQLKIRMFWPGAEDTGGLPGDITSLTATRGDRIDLTIALEDAKGRGIPGQKLFLASSTGNDLGHPTRTTDQDGRTNVSIAAEALGKDTITVTGVGATKTLKLVVNRPFGYLPDATDESQPSSEGLTASLPKVEGVTPWKTLASDLEFRLKDGIYTLEVGDSVKALNGKKVKLQGFMMPLEDARQQKHFLLSANSPHCFFCLPGGPGTIVEVNCNKAVEFTFDPIVITGTLEVVEESDVGLVYRLNKAKKIDG